MERNLRRFGERPVLNRRDGQRGRSSFPFDVETGFDYSDRVAGFTVTRAAPLGYRSVLGLDLEPELMAEDADLSRHLDADPDIRAGDLAAGTGKNGAEQGNPPWPSIQAQERPRTVDDRDRRNA
jgi:hypothetical protein